MEKFDVYVFWIGDNKPSKIEDWKIRYKSINFILGPSLSDHKFLMDNFLYYKNSFERGIFSFCSDVWRFWKLSQSKGMYIDTSVSLGQNFELFVKKYYNKGPIFFKENKNNVASCVFFGPIGDEPLNHIKKYTGNPLIYHIAPEILTAMNFNDATKKSLLEIRNKMTLFKYGEGSWSNEGKDKAKSHWDKIEREWRAGRPGKGKTQNIDLPNILFLRNIYDLSSSRSEIKYLQKEYKNLLSQVKVSLFKRLIWSKLYRFFTGKWLITK